MLQTYAVKRTTIDMAGWQVPVPIPSEENTQDFILGNSTSLTSGVWIYLPEVVERTTTQRDGENNHHPTRPNSHEAKDDAPPELRKTSLSEREPVS